MKHQKKHEDGSFKGEKWKTSSTYTGAWEDNKKAGFGIQVYKNGDKYEGGWREGLREGQGTLWVPDAKKNLRRRYTGDWVKDKKQGRGTMFFSNEDRYDGFWMNNRPSGEGRMIYKNGDVYVGNWDDGKRSGYGVLTKRNGNHFEGNWVNDMREGQGSYFYAQKNKLFVGEFAEDIPKAGIYTEVQDENELLMPSKSDKLRDFDDIPPIPVLGLVDPKGVLDKAFKITRARRIFYRARFMSIQLMFQQEELEEMLKEFVSFGERTISHEQALLLLEQMGIEVEPEALPEFLSKIDEEIPSQLDFELFARTVAIILEENNKLPDDALQDIDEEESIYV